jgi:hypothetical protein
MALAPDLGSCRGKPRCRSQRVDFLKKIANNSTVTEARQKVGKNLELLQKNIKYLMTNEGKVV